MWEAKQAGMVPWRNQVKSGPGAEQQLQGILSDIDAAQRHMLRIRKHLAVLQQWLAGKPETGKTGNLSDTYRKTRQDLLEHHDTLAAWLGPFCQPERQEEQGGGDLGPTEGRLLDDLCQPTSLEGVFRACSGRPVEIRRRLARVLQGIGRWENSLKHWRKAIIDELDHQPPLFSPTGPELVASPERPGAQ